MFLISPCAVPIQPDAVEVDVRMLKPGTATAGGPSHRDVVAHASRAGQAPACVDRARRVWSAFSELPVGAAVQLPTSSTCDNFSPGCSAGET
jgi:hypothetical protein